jgi:hypothetical protein
MFTTTEHNISLEERARVLARSLQSVAPDSFHLSYRTVRRRGEHAVALFDMREIECADADVRSREVSVKLYEAGDLSCTITTTTHAGLTHRDDLFDGQVSEVLDMLVLLDVELVRAPAAKPAMTTSAGALRPGETGIITDGEFTGRTFAIRSQVGSRGNVWVDWATGPDGEVPASTPCQRTAPADFCALRGHAARVTKNSEEDTCPRCGAFLTF